MNKATLVDKIATNAGLTKEQAGKAFDSVFAETSNALCNGETVAVPGFGTFTPKRMAARKARNLAANTIIDVPEKTVVKFKAGKQLAEAVVDVKPSK